VVDDTAPLPPDERLELEAAELAAVVREIDKQVAERTQRLNAGTLERDQFDDWYFRARWARDGYARRHAKLERRLEQLRTPSPKTQQQIERERLQAARAAASLEAVRLERERQEAGRAAKEMRDQWLEGYWKALLQTELVLSDLNTHGVDIGTMGRSLLREASSAVPERYRQKFAELCTRLGWSGPSAQKAES